MADYKLLSETKNRFYREHETGKTKISLFWHNDIPVCIVKECEEIPTDAEEIDPQEFDEVADSISTYAKIKNRPPGLPPH